MYVAEDEAEQIIGLANGGARKEPNELVEEVKIGWKDIRVIL